MSQRCSSSPGRGEELYSPCRGISRCIYLPTSMCLTGGAEIRPALSLPSLWGPACLALDGGGQLAGGHGAVHLPRGETHQPSHQQQLPVSSGAALERRRKMSWDSLFSRPGSRLSHTARRCREGQEGSQPGSSSATGRRGWFSFSAMRGFYSPLPAELQPP